MTDYDLFVSYKSHDVMAVRPVVDYLIALGARVWFAEYEVLLAERDRFQEAIDAGIRNAARGLIFTNDRYIGSEHCRHELEMLLTHVGPENLLEIQLPAEEGPHRAYPALERSARAEAGSAGGLANRARQWLGLPALDPPKPRRRPYTDAAGRHAGSKGRTVYSGTLMGRPWHLTLDGWTVEKDPAADPRSAGSLPEFKFATRNPVLFANVAAGPDVSPETQRDLDLEDDRQVYDFLLGYALRHERAVGAKVEGVHLLFSPPGTSQFGITYWTPSARGPAFWTRKISFVLGDPGTAQNAEFVFTFGLLGGREHWRDYCLMTRAMDQLACSLEWN